MDLDLSQLKISAQPQIIAAVMKLKNEDTDMSFKDLENLIKADQNMAALILKVANSPFYTRGNKITTLEHAIGILGFKLVHSLATVLSTKSIFSGGNYTRFKKLVWEHSVVTGIIARQLASKLPHKGGKDWVEEFFVGGLLHDIGKAVLNALDRKKFIEVINVVSEQNLSFEVAENKVFGYNHKEVGLQAAKLWNFPEEFFAVIEHHYTPAEISNVEDKIKIMVYVVAYANYLAKANGYGIANDDSLELAEKAEKVLKISEEDKIYYHGKYKDDLKKDDLYKSFFHMMG